MGRASDLTIRGVFLPWSDWNIEGPPYVDLPLEERAQLVFSALFGSGPNGAAAINASSNHELTTLGALSTCQTQLANHAVNTITLPAAGSNLRNVITWLMFSILGTGTAPSQAAPVTFTIADGANIIFQYRIVTFGNGPIITPSGAGIVGSPNTPMSISVTDPGLNNSSIINCVSMVR